MQEEACINIGPAQRRIRLNFGLAMLAVSGAQAAWLLFAGFSRWLRLSLFLTFSMAGYGIFQARARTCVRLAAKGVRNLDDGEETIVETAVAEQLQKQANKVKIQALGMGVALTLLALVLPVGKKK